MMTSPTGAADAAIADYLDDLRDALASLPRDRRRELVRDLEAHIGTARAELADPFSEAEIRNILDRLGTPEEIAEAEGVEPERVAPAPAPVAPQPSWREPAAIILLLFGGFVGGIGWLAGLILLWASPRWRTSDKLVGTFVLPGGLALSAGGLLVLAGTSVETCTGFGAVSECHGGATVALIVIAAALVILPLATAAHLAFSIGRGDEDA
jgi:uncharacterized membrane protein